MAMKKIVQAFIVMELFWIAASTMVIADKLGYMGAWEWFVVIVIGNLIGIFIATSKEGE